MICVYCYNGFGILPDKRAVRFDKNGEQPKEGSWVLAEERVIRPKSGAKEFSVLVFKSVLDINADLIKTVDENLKAGQELLLRRERVLSAEKSQFGEFCRKFKEDLDFWGSQSKFTLGPEDLDLTDVRLDYYSCWSVRFGAVTVLDYTGCRIGLDYDTGDVFYGGNDYLLLPCQTRGGGNGFLRISDDFGGFTAKGLKGAFLRGRKATEPAREVRAGFAPGLVERAWDSVEYGADTENPPIFEPELYAGFGIRNAPWGFFKSRYTEEEFRRFVELLLPGCLEGRTLPQQLMFFKRSKEILDLELTKDFISGIRMVLGKQGLTETDLNWIREILKE
jgi:hypothetical protein